MQVSLNSFVANNGIFDPRSKVLEEVDYGYGIAKTCQVVNPKYGFDSRFKSLFHLWVLDSDVLHSISILTIVTIVYFIVTSVPFHI